MRLKCALDQLRSIVSLQSHRRGEPPIVSVDTPGLTLPSVATQNFRQGTHIGQWRETQPYASIDALGGESVRSRTYPHAQAFSIDGSRIASGYSNGHLSIQPINRSGPPVIVLDLHPSPLTPVIAQSLSFSTLIWLDDNRLFYATRKGNFGIVDSRSIIATGTLQHSLGENVQLSTAISVDRKRAYVAAQPSSSDNVVLYAIDLVSGTEQISTLPPQSSVIGAGSSPGTVLLHLGNEPSGTWTFRPEFVVFNVAESRVMARYYYPGTLQADSFQRSLVATDTEIFLYSGTTGDLVRWTIGNPIAQTVGNTGRNGGLRFSLEQSELYAWGTGGGGFVYNPGHNEATHFSTGLYFYRMDRAGRILERIRLERSAESGEFHDVAVRENAVVVAGTNAVNVFER